MDTKTSEIAKLTERISRDPKSKLFVPLAEEYKKAGDINMAIHVLTEGLKNNPGYVTARSFLGKLLVEKGDLPSAQKEFEEVVRAIPDNLMAQRKLADLYALQDRPAEAAAHYKIALSLNPKDTETALLLKETEAGRSVKNLLRGNAPAEKQEPKKTQLSPKPAAVPAAASPQLQPTSAAPLVAEREKPVGPAALATEEEVAEEVLTVEPLETPEAVPPAGSTEQPSLETALAAPEVLDFLSEAQPEQAAPVIAQEDEDLFGLNEQAAAPQPVEVMPDPFAAEEVLPVFAEETPASEAVREEASPVSELFQEKELPNTVEAKTAESGKQADDFTTDTLAELYISQGFFEKAVDIYERMLADNPHSQGLKDKLMNVRQMAATASPAAEAETETIEAEVVEDDIFGGQEPVPAAEPSFETEQPAVAGQEPSVDEWDLTESKAVSPTEQELPAKPVVQTGAVDDVFVPREYIPPDAVRISSEEPGEAGPGDGKSFEEPGEPVLPATLAGKKKTVDRLEKWLKNIRKEN